MQELSSMHKLSPPAPPSYEDQGILEWLLIRSPWPWSYLSKLTHPSQHRRKNQPDDETNNQGQLLGRPPSQDATCCHRFIHTLICFILLLTFIFLVLVPIIMIALGAFFFEECGEDSPYPLWLIVSGAAICGVNFFTVLLTVTGTKNMGLHCIYWLVLLFPVAWFVMGWYYLTGSWSHGRGRDKPEDYYLTYNTANKWRWVDFIETDCVYPYWVVFWLSIIPFVLLAAGLGILIVGGIICCFSTSIEDLQAPADV